MGNNHVKKYGDITFSIDWVSDVFYCFLPKGK
jgi:hypothetical protein